MLLLAVETSTQIGSIALFDENKILAERVWPGQRTHSAEITMGLQEILAEAGVTLKDLKGLAVDHGPGSFTGIRVAVNMVRALSYSLQIPVVTGSSLTLLAQETPAHCTEIISILNAQNNAFFLGSYQRTDAGLLTVEEALVPVEEFRRRVQNSPNKRNIIYVGDGLNDYWSLWPQEFRQLINFDPTQFLFPSARQLGQWARGQFAAGATFDWFSVKPLYLRLSAAEEKIGRCV